MNCCVFPAAALAELGDTAIKTSTGGPTVSTAELWMVPDAAVMFAAPIAMPTASPFDPTEATVGVSEVHVADPVRSCVLPSV